MENKQQIIGAVREALGINPEQGYNAKPSQFQVFKGKSAMRVQLDKPNRDEQEYKVGCLYLQAAPSKPGGRNAGYDWEGKKVSVKIGVNDITEVIYRIKRRENVNLFHEFGGDTKTIRFDLNEERGGYFLGIEQKSTKAGDNKVSVPLTPQETDALLIMLEYALPKIHNW